MSSIDNRLTRLRSQLASEKLTVGELRRIIRGMSSERILVFERIDKDGNLFDTRYASKAYGAYRYGEDALVVRLGNFARKPGGDE